MWKIEQQDWKAKNEAFYTGNTIIIRIGGIDTCIFHADT